MCVAISCEQVLPPCTVLEKASGERARKLHLPKICSLPPLQIAIPTCEGVAAVVFLTVGLYEIGAHHIGKSIT
eukprot:scaffold5103_cov115-Skeletonema_dohrnii-CCMP3373.AAC.6